MTNQIKERLLLIYNPVSGEGSFKDKLDQAVNLLQKKNFQVIVHRANLGEGFEPILLNNKNYISAVACVGGDGTVHQLVNSLVKCQMTEIPFGIIPMGTSNDLANYLGIPNSVSGAIDIIGDRKQYKMDIGEANGRYFVNVASGGLMMEVPHTTSIKLKSIIGRLAYYLKGIEMLPTLRPIPVRLSCPEKTIDDELLLFIVLNGGMAGGFKNLAPWASINDGKLDVLVFKPVPIPRLMSLFMKLIKGEHIGDRSLIYFQTEGPVEISCDFDVGFDLDGEKGPSFPMLIDIHPRKISIFAK